MLRESRINIVALGLLMLLGGALGVYMAHNDLNLSQVVTGHEIWAMGAMALICVLSWVVCLVWWKKVDEAVREAHKSAWFWGGSLGLMMVAPIIVPVAISRSPSHQSMIDLFHMQGHEVELGMLLILVPMVFGYVLGWVYWWVRRR